MARDAHLDRDRLIAADLDGLLNDSERLVGAAKLRHSAGRIQMLAIEVLDIGGDVGLPPGNEAVPPDGDGRRARKRGANHVEVAGRHVRQIPERRHVRAKMRIVGEHGFAARREGSVDNPVIRTERLRPRAGEQQSPDRSITVRKGARERRRPRGACLGLFSCRVHTVLRHTAAVLLRRKGNRADRLGIKSSIRRPVRGRSSAVRGRHACHHVEPNQLVE